MLTWLLWGAGSFLAGWFVGQMDRMAYNDRQRRRTQRSTNICEFKTRATSSFDEGPTARTTSGPGPTAPKPEIVPGFHGSRRTVRWFINNPVQISECGGPCIFGPSHCDCGALWVDKPTPNQPPTDP